MKKIAELAGVSRGTVDRVLNNRGSVSPETERKIREIAQRLGYKPNLAGLALAAQKKKCRLGVILFGPDNPFFDRVLAGVSEQAAALAEYDCAVLIRQVSFDAQAQLDAISELAAEGIHGLVLTPYNDPAIRERIDRLADEGIPVVTTNTDIEGSRRIGYVGSNYYRDGQTAGGLMRLVTGGRAKLGIISGSSRVLCHTDRIAGFTEVIRRTAPGIEILDTLMNHDDEAESYAVTSRFLKEHPEADAVFFAAAGLGGGCRAILESGRAEGIRIICFDADETHRPMLENGLISASISQQPMRQGSLPLRLLFDHLTTGKLPDPEISYVDAAIRIRENL